MPNELMWNELLRDAVRASGLSLYAISQRSGVKYPPLERFVKGRNGLTVDSAEKLGRVVGVELRPIKRRAR